MAFKVTPKKRKIFSAMGKPEIISVQGTLKEFPKHLICNPPEYPIFWIQVPDLLPLEFFTEPLVFLNTKRGLEIEQALKDNKVIQYAQLSGPIKHDTATSSGMADEKVFQLRCWLIGDTGTMPPPELMKIYPGRILWLSKEDLEAEIADRVLKELSKTRQVPPSPLPPPSPTMGTKEQTDPRLERK